MDLSALDITSGANKGATLELRHPATGAVLTDDAGKALTITLAGEDSDLVQGVRREATNRRLKASRSGPLRLTAEEIEEEAINLLATATMAWSGLQIDGKAIEFSKAAAKDLYRRMSWIRNQVDAFVSDPANFVPQPTKH